MISGTPTRLVVAAVPYGAATLSVALQESSPNGALLEVTSDDSVYQAARAQTGIQQSGWAIYVADQLIDLSNFTGSISVNRSYDQVLQSWSFELSLDTPAGPLGSPFQAIGPPTGRKTVAVYGVYRLDNGSTKLVPLILDGVADNSRRSARSDGSCVESITGVDRGGRFDQEVVTLVLPPGHGFPRGRVLRLLAERAGETQFNLADGNPMMKEVQAVDTDWLALGLEQHEVENRRVLWDTQGDLWNPQVGRPRADEPDHFDLDETDFLKQAEVTIAHKAYVLTDVTLTGSEQVASDEQVCALSPQTPQVVTTEKVYAPAVQPYVRATSSTIGASGLSAGTPSRRVVGRVFYQQVLRCGTLVYERQTEWAYRNPLGTRLSWSGAAWELVINRWLPDNDPAAFGLAYVRGVEPFIPIADSETWHFYMQQNFVYPSGASSDRYGHLRGLYPYTINSTTGEWEGEYVGFYLGSINRVSALGFVRKAVRERSNLVPPLDVFSTLDPISGTVMIGSEAVDTSPTLPWRSKFYAAAKGTVGSGEALIPQSETIKHVLGDADGYKVRDTVITRKWSHAPVKPGLFEYGDGTESMEITDTFQESERVATDYLGKTDGESTHRELVTRYLFGQFESSVKSESKSGDRPPVPKLQTTERNVTAYADAAELAEFARYARRMDTRQIKVRVTADGLLTTHFPGVLKTDVPWAENAEELAQVGIYLIDESAAAVVNFQVLANYYLREAQAGRLTFYRLGLDHRVRLQSVGNAGPVHGPVITSCTALLYGWGD